MCISYMDGTEIILMILKWLILTAEAMFTKFMNVTFVFLMSVYCKDVLLSEGES